MPRALRGMQGLVIIDEAAFHDELDELLKAAFALLIWGGKVLVISTHDGDENPFNTLVQDVRAAAASPTVCCGATSTGPWRWPLQAHLPQAGKPWSMEAEAKWRDEIIAFYGGGADEELFCIPSRGTGAYLPLALLESRSEQIPVIGWEQPAGFAEVAEHLRTAECRDWCEATLAPQLLELSPDRQHFFGQDFARSGDLSVIWPLALHKDMVRRPPFVVEMRNIPFEQQKQVLFFVLDRLPRFACGKMDATGPRAGAELVLAS
jgi:phage FluMu gp28-like protein